MSKHEVFSFQSSADLLKKAQDLEVELPYQDDINPLFETATIGSKRVINRLIVQPMEGFDGELDGAPSELTFRRYRRFAEGGGGLLWVEATSIVPQGRSNPRQLMIGKRNLDSFKRLVEQTRQSARRVFGNAHDLFLVLQLTHSGRYSRPEGRPYCQVATFIPFLDRDRESVSVLSDEELDCLKEKFIEASRLACNAGFDAVDIKACHGYLVNELLAAFKRKGSRYGESFNNRTRFLKEVVQGVREEVSGIFLSVRLSACDVVPYPVGFGVSVDGTESPDLNEPRALISQLIESGCSFFNITVGNPHLNPHVGRPYDRPVPGTSLPEEHPLEGIGRLLGITGKLQREFPEIPFVGTGYSWLRHFFPHVGAAVIDREEASFIGLGRSLLAYPDAPKDLMTKGALDSKKVCIACSRCSELTRASLVSGCMMKDKEIYGAEYQKLLAEEQR